MVSFYLFPTICIGYNTESPHSQAGALERGDMNRLIFFNASVYVCLCVESLSSVLTVNANIKATVANTASA
jgi:hypothetical protein